MKKIIALLIAIIIGMFSTTATTMAEVVDTPTSTKVYEWAAGYSKRCRKYGKVQPRNWTHAKRFARRVMFAPMCLMLGAEVTPSERYYTILSKGGTPDEAKAALNAADLSEVKKPNARRATHPRWAKVDPERVGFLSTESLNTVVSAMRGWFHAAGLNGFDRQTVLAYQWFKPDEEESPKEPPEHIIFRGEKYILWCAGQGGVKKGSAIYLTRKFLYAETDGKKNHFLLDVHADLPMNRVNQIRALSFTACEKTHAKMKDVIVLQAQQREDDVDTIVDKRPVVHVDVQNEYKLSKAEKVKQALADGGCTYGPQSGINTPVAQFRNEKGMKCAGVKFLSKWIGIILTDAFGCQVEVTASSIISTTDNHKDIKPFLEKVKNGEMTGEEAKAAWLETQGGPEGKIYSCPVHPQNGRVTLGRQIFGKLSQLSDEALFRVVSRDLGKLAMMGFENGYKKALQRKYAALRIPELANLLDHPLLHQDEVRSYISRWHKLASGGVEVNGSLALAVIDPDWFDDVYVGGKSVDDPTAGKLKPGQILFGTKNKDGVNPYIGKKVVLARFPQVKSGLPVVEVVGDAPASGVVVVSGQPGDMVLQDLDADLDGDKFYVIDDEDIVEAVEKANNIFQFPHVVFSKWETVASNETLAQYLGRNAQWQHDESVGTFATHQFVIDEMVPLLEEGQDWKTLLRPTLDDNGEYSDFITLEEVLTKYNPLLGVGGNMATDAGKLNHKPDAPEYITKRLAFRPMSQRDAHPNTPDSGFKKRLTAFLPNKYPGVGKDVLRRLHDLMMKLIPIEEVGRDAINDFAYDENGRIIQDRPKTMWCPQNFEPIPENVWKHTFGNELDSIKTSLVCYPSDAETVELNEDLQVFSEASEGISLVTYFAKYAARIVAIETGLNDDKKGWTVAGRDTFGDNLILFVRTATGRKDISEEDCLWLAYNALCQSFIGTKSQSRGTAFAISQFLKLFEGMLISQVCRNTGAKAPKVFGDKVSIKDSVTKEPATKEAEPVRTTDEVPPDESFNCMDLYQQLKAETTTDEVPPTETVDVSVLLQQLNAERDNEQPSKLSSFEINIDDEEYIDDEE